MRPFAAVVTGAGLLLASTSASGVSQAPSRVLDRTFACSTTLWAGLREVSLQAQSAVAGQKDYEGRPARPLAAFGTGSSSHARLLGAGRESPSVAASAPGTFWVSTEKCRPAQGTVPLSRQRLSGGAVSPFGAYYECQAPRTVIIRARAVFRSPTTLRQNAATKQLVTTTPLREAHLAARTPAGRLLILASVLGSGQVKVFAAPGCARP